MLNRNDGKPSAANYKRNEDSVVRHSSNGVKSLGKTNNMSSGKVNGGSTVKKELSEKVNGGSSVKKELSEKANGASGMKRESTDKTNGSGAVKREAAEVKKEASSSGSKTVVKKTSTAARVLTKEEKKKVFTLPGQKHEPPVEREPLRIFYESLHEQRPDSEMAEFWMMEHGLLSPERAKRAFEKKQKRGSSSSGTPVKSSTSYRDNSIKALAKAPASNGKQSASKGPEQKGKRKWEHDDSDDDLLIARPLKRKLKS